MDALARLGRTDKWFLGGGRGAIWAPPFPKHLTAPGFWDESYFADIRIPRLFSVLFADADGVPIRFESYHKGWRPDRMTVMHYSGDVVVRERRCVTENNAWVCELELVTAVRPLHVFMWSLPPVREAGYGEPWSSLSDLEVGEATIRMAIDTAWPHHTPVDRTAIESHGTAGAKGQMDPPVRLFLELGASADRHSWTVNQSQAHDESPRYELSVLPEKFRDGRLPKDFKLWVGPPQDGLVHVVQHYRLDDRRPIQIVAGAGLTAEAARSSFATAVAEGAIERSTESWRTYFASVPQFESSDPFLTNAYWNRWYGLRLNTVDLPALPIAGRPESFAPFVTEGVGFFRNFVTYSAQAHLREVSWMHDPRLGKGILDNLGRVQHEDGSFPGHSYSGRGARDFYHADFATGMQQLERIHPGSVSAKTWDTMARYADHLIASRRQSAVGPTMYDIFDQNETGQEYMSRYAFASEAADEWASFRVGAVDATTYAARLFRALTAAGYPKYSDLADAAVAGLLQHSRDVSASFFCDRLADGRLSPARPATGLYALLVEEVRASLTDNAVDAILSRWLLNPAEFWLAAGFPATAASDPTFSAEAEWKERRLNCPWNGRSWPMTNFHLVDALAASRPASPVAATALMRSVRLMFHSDDPFRPNSYEHYNPITGVPALYRGYDDYMHSWLNDAILRHAVGIRPGEVEVSPLPLDVDWITCYDIPNAGGRMDVEVRREEKPVVEVR